MGSRPSGARRLDNSDIAPNHGHKLRKEHGGALQLPVDEVDSNAQHTNASGAHVSTSLSTNIDGDVASSSQQASQSAAPGLKQPTKSLLSRGVCYWESRANQATEQAVLEDDHYKEKMIGVKKGKMTSSGKGSGPLGGFPNRHRSEHRCYWSTWAR
jgi:hypothetical protein